MFLNEISMYLQLRNLLTFLFIFYFINSYSQSPAQAERLFNAGNYSSALKLYKQLVDKNPKSTIHNYRLARCYFETKNFSKAIEYFLLSGTKYTLTPYYLGLAYFENYQFEDAIYNLKNYIVDIDSNKTEYKVISDKIRKAEIARPLMNRIEKVYILDSVICSKNDFLKFYHYSSMAGKLKQKIIKTQGGYKDQISYYTQRNDRHIFSEEVKGKTDIMTSFQLLNSWSEPVSISNNVNSIANENYPFLMPDGATLYFASDGTESIGGYDILVTKYTASFKDFLKPENVGFPFNSFANDYMMVIDESKGVGWFATDRGQKSGKLIIYQFEVNAKKEFFNQTDSVDYTAFAKLKAYFRSDKVNQISTKDLLDGDSTKINSEWTLFINDTLSYKDENQFKSKKALEIFEKWYESYLNLATQTELMTNLRKKYDIAENQGAKREIGPQILELELEIIRIKKDLKEYELLIRNEENKTLNL